MPKRLPHLTLIHCLFALSTLLGSEHFHKRIKDTPSRRPAGEGSMVGGGGGTGIRDASGNLTLLDLHLIPKKALLNEKGQKSFLTSPKGKPQQLKVPLFKQDGNPFKEIQVKVQNAGGDPEDKFYQSFFQSESFRFAKGAMDRYPMILSLPVAMMESLNWLFTTEAPENQFRFDDKGLTSKKIETLAYYYHLNNYSRGRKMNAILSIPRWNRLDFSGQAGLIVHETLRHFQISVLSRPNDPEFAENALQKATALITLCEQDEYIEQYLYRLLSRYNGKFGGEEGLGEGYSFERAKAFCQ